MHMYERLSRDQVSSGNWNSRRRKWINM